MLTGESQIPNLPFWSARLKGLIDAGKGARLGETSVVSTKVHMLCPGMEGTVRILGQSDAGQVFYNRTRPSEVIHVDVFHSESVLDHRRIAAAIIGALAAFERDFGKRVGDTAGVGYADYIDVQTASGGGRITGTLDFGRKASLRTAHLTHVHITAAWRADVAPVLLYVIAEVEKEIQAQGAELRRVDRIAVDFVYGSEMGLDSYSTPSDSYLKESAPRGGSGFDHEFYRQELADVLRWIQEQGSPRDLYRVLDEVASGMERGPGHDPLSVEARSRQRILEGLESSGFVASDRGKKSLTPRGVMVLRYLNEHWTEIERLVRRQARKFPTFSSTRIVAATAPRSTGGRGVRTRIPKPHDEGEPIADLAIPETVASALRRSIARNSQVNRDWTRPAVSAEDVHIYLKRFCSRQDMVLLIDASASMAGRRMNAAKQLARHLLMVGGGRLAVLAFQERGLRVCLPFTRDYALAEEGLGRLEAFGLTPLAHGVCDCLEFLRAERAKNPLILLITDGVPTVPKWSTNPLADALHAAEEIRRKRVSLICVGLEPNRRFMERFAEVAGGRLYIVEELEASELIAIAWKERRRVQRG